ncbi:non-homologous end-joining factor 1-like isoform X1 [Mytilus californianus]|uniref:non-homologous end-joining factor 1-like isoform X1 n=1 Tax=Mytilus californianus TaxID=6549 RepID=UPI0022479571|nr:non-homologous end-joining factor 1-like isoform X1 [Mytilus californianus]
MTTEIEWRRRWKPDLTSIPWQPLNIDGYVYLIKCNFTQNSYELLLTNLKSFWHEELSENALKKRVQKLNPSIEASVSRILDQIKNCLESQERGTSITIGFKDEEENSKMVLKINSQLAGLPFCWNFVGNAADKEMASENLIVPLMAMVGELTRRQRELIKILQSKDKEIDDYKSQGGKTTRKHIETQEFVETAFENTMLMSKGFEEEVESFGSSAFDDSGQDLYRQIMTKHSWLHRQKNDTETESSSLDEEELPVNDTSDEGRKPSTGTSWGSSRLPPSVAGPKSMSPSQKSPNKSPASSKSNTPDTSPIKDTELMRRQALERRLESDEAKKQEKAKKKKKMAF